MVDRRDLAGDDGRGPVEIDVGPAEAEALAAPAAGGRDEDPRRQVAVVDDEAEERPELLGRPRRPLAESRRTDRRGSGGVGHVAGDAVPAHGVLHGGVEDRVDVAHRPRVEPGRWRHPRRRWLLAAAVEGGHGVAGDARFAWECLGDSGGDRRVSAEVIP